MSLFGLELPKSVTTAASNIYGNAVAAFDKVTTAGTWTNLLDPSKARLTVAGLFSGGGSPAYTSNTARFANTIEDWRVKVSLAAGADYFYAATTSADRGILEPLSITGGVIFPYTPQISVTHTARYGSQALTHSNYTNYSYEGSDVAAITITGEFTAQNSTEAAYVMACIQFFRSATKMWWGSDSRAGNPPPMVFLTGYGENYFPNVPCVITSFQHTMPQDVDYVQATSTFELVPASVVSRGNNPSASVSQAATTQTQTTMIPTTSQIVITLQPIYSRKNIYENFSLDSFAKGALLGDKKSGKGGFI